MKHDKKMLSLVIPTRNRAECLNRTIEHLYHAAQNIDSDLIEIIIGDNASTDLTAEIVKHWQLKFPAIRYVKQSVFLPTAEESLYATLDYATGEYVWTLGDDDEPTEDCIGRLLYYITEFEPDYITNNIDYKINSTEPLKYLRVNAEVVVYEQCSDLFRDFGFCQITCAFYASCFRRSLLDKTVYQRLSNLSPIYSHVFTLFACFYNKKAIFVVEPLIIATMNEPENELVRISRATNLISQFSYYSWHLGLLRLLKEVSSITQIGLSKLLYYKEPLFDRTTHTVKYLYLKSFIQHFIDIESSAQKKGTFLKAEIELLDPEFCLFFTKNKTGSSLFYKTERATRNELAVLGWGDDQAVRLHGDPIEKSNLHVYMKKNGYEEMLLKQRLIGMLCVRSYYLSVRILRKIKKEMQRLFNIFIFEV